MTSRAMRAKSLFQIAAIPALMLSVFGDFFTPIGGAAVVAVTGLVSIVLALQLLMTSGSGSPSLLERVVGREEKNAWWWEGRPAIKRHGFGVAIVFGLICLVSARQSLANRGSGGYMAESVPAVSAAQHRLLGEIATNTRETADNTREIADNTQAAKRETSDDPRKELSNQGQDWNVAGLASAMERGDARSVELYIRGGMPVSVFKVFYAWNEDVARVVRESSVVGDESECRGGVDTSRTMAFFAETSDLGPGSASQHQHVREGVDPDDVRVDSDKVATFKSLCGMYPQIIAGVRDSCDAMLDEYGSLDPGTGGAEILRLQLPFCRKLAKSFR